MTESQNHGVPALLSFFWPGLGQLIKGHVLRGIGIMALAFLAALSVLIGVGILLYPAVWIYATYDAYNR